MRVYHQCPRGRHPPQRSDPGYTRETKST